MTAARALSFPFGSAGLSQCCLGRCRWLLLLHMPPPIAHSPKGTCFNFPLCSQQKSQGKTESACHVLTSARSVPSPRDSAPILAAPRLLLLVSKKTNASCSVPFTMPTLRMRPHGVGIAATIRPLDVDVSPQKWLADLVMLVAAMNILSLIHI